MKKYHLLAPGPTPIPPEVLQAIAQPILHHRTPAFESLFGRVRAGLAELIGKPVPLAPDSVGPEVEQAVARLRDGECLMLENLRFHAEEEKNDEGFARGLAALGDVYVNDAFAAAHRAHASIEAITRFLQPAAAGARGYRLE